MNKSDQPPLGTILKEDWLKDAIHVAVCSVYASEVLRPGEHIGFSGLDQTTVVGHTTAETYIGIVDPFLREDVQPGQLFFMFLYPGSVTGMRHEWQHPAFLVGWSHAPRDPRHESRRWLRLWASRYGLEYDDLLRQALSKGEWGGYIVAKGTDLHSRPADADELFAHIEVVTGITLSKEHKDGHGFSCSC